jgi:uncharacterized protein YdaU (DUF1376 family)
VALARAASSTGLTRVTKDKTDAWMPLWIGAYLADTLTFTTVQHGAYLLLLMAYWRERAPLPDVDEDLAAIAKMTPPEWRKVRPKLERKFRVGDGVWWHKRVEQEMADADARSKKASEKASKGAEARWKKGAKQSPDDAPSMPEALLGQCPTPSPTPTSLRSGSVPDGTGGDAPPPQSPKERRSKPRTAMEEADAQLWRDLKTLFVDHEAADDIKAAGNLLGGLAKKYGSDVFKEAARAMLAASPRPVEPHAYLVAMCETAAGRRVALDQPKETAYQRANRERMEAFAPGAVARPPAPHLETIDVDAVRLD